MGRRSEGFVKVDAEGSSGLCGWRSRDEQDPLNEASSISHDEESLYIHPKSNQFDESRSCVNLFVIHEHDMKRKNKLLHQFTRLSCGANRRYLKEQDAPRFQPASTFDRLPETVPVTDSTSSIADSSCTSLFMEDDPAYSSKSPTARRQSPTRVTQPEKPNRREVPARFKQLRIEIPPLTPTPKYRPTKRVPPDFSSLNHVLQECFGDFEMNQGPHYLRQETESVKIEGPSVTEWPSRGGYSPAIPLDAFGLTMQPRAVDRRSPSESVGSASRDDRVTSESKSSGSSTSWEQRPSQAMPSLSLGSPQEKRTSPSESHSSDESTQRSVHSSANASSSSGRSSMRSKQTSTSREPSNNNDNYAPLDDEESINSTEIYEAAAREIRQLKEFLKKLDSSIQIEQPPAISAVVTPEPRQAQERTPSPPLRRSSRQESPGLKQETTPRDWQRFKQSEKNSGSSEFLPRLDKNLCQAQERTPSPPLRHSSRQESPGLKQETTPRDWRRFNQSEKNSGSSEFLPRLDKDLDPVRQYSDLSIQAAARLKERKQGGNPVASPEHSTVSKTNPQTSLRVDSPRSSQNKSVSFAPETKSSDRWKDLLPENHPHLQAYSMEEENKVLVDSSPNVYHTQSEDDTETSEEPSRGYEIFFESDRVILEQYSKADSNYESDDSRLAFEQVAKSAALSLGKQFERSPKLYEDLQYGFSNDSFTKDESDLFLPPDSPRNLYSSASEKQAREDKKGTHRSGGSITTKTSVTVASSQSISSMSSTPIVENRQAARLQRPTSRNLLTTYMYN